MLDQPTIINAAEGWVTQRIRFYRKRIWAYNGLKIRVTQTFQTETER